MELREARLNFFSAWLTLMRLSTVGVFGSATCFVAGGGGAEEVPVSSAVGAEVVCGGIVSFGGWCKRLSGIVNKSGGGVGGSGRRIKT
jgi:hypothetical protein